MTTFSIAYLIVWLTVTVYLARLDRQQRRLWRALRGEEPA